MPLLQDDRLHEAVQAGDIHCVDKLLASGWNVNGLDNKVCRPIYSYGQRRCPAST